MVNNLNVMRKKLILLFGIILLLPLVLAETTFIEGKFYVSGVNPTPPSGRGGGGYIPPSCNPLWICNEWSSCFGGLRSRTCSDISYCNSYEKPPLLLSCSESLPSDRIVGCVTFSDLNLLINGWKVNFYQFSILDESIRKWKHNIDC